MSGDKNTSCWIAGEETKANVKSLVEILRDPPQLPFAMYIELDCWNWKLVTEMATENAEIPLPSRLSPFVSPVASPNSSVSKADSEKTARFDATPANGSLVYAATAAAPAPAASPSVAPTLPDGKIKAVAAPAATAASAPASSPPPAAPAADEAAAEAEAPAAGGASSGDDEPEDVYVPLDVLHSGAVA